MTFKVKESKVTSMSKFFFFAGESKMLMTAKILKLQSFPSAIEVSVLTDYILLVISIMHLFSTILPLSSLKLALLRSSRASLLSSVGFLPSVSAGLLAIMPFNNVYVFTSEMWQVTPLTPKSNSRFCRLNLTKKWTLLSLHKILG